MDRRKQSLARLAAGSPIRVCDVAAVARMVYGANVADVIAGQPLRNQIQGPGKLKGAWIIPSAPGREPFEPGEKLQNFRRELRQDAPVEGLALGPWHVTSRRVSEGDLYPC
jgi:hypothetical protein